MQPFKIVKKDFQQDVTEKLYKKVKTCWENLYNAVENRDTLGTAHRAIYLLILDNDIKALKELSERLNVVLKGH